MPLEIKAIHASFHIVDTDVPGWETLERHAEEGRAQERLQVLQAARGGSLAVLGQDGADDALQAMLRGRAGDVRRRVQETADAEALAALADLEAAGLGRPTVLGAIQKRLEALAS